LLVLARLFLQEVLNVTAFYMVELAFPFPAERAGFDDFYSGHIDMLLSIEGLNAAQRFEARHEALAPFMAIYSLAHDAVLESDGYTSRAGPDSVSMDYRPKMLNWKRNVVTGPQLHLDVPMDGWLVIVDRMADDSPALPAKFLPFKPIALDMTVAERGVLVGQDSDPPQIEAQTGWIVRSMKPLHLRRES
jgi:hypothetical protein